MALYLQLQVWCANSYCLLKTLQILVYACFYYAKFSIVFPFSTEHLKAFLITLKTRNGCEPVACGFESRPWHGGLAADLILMGFGPFLISVLRES